MEGSGGEVRRVHIIYFLSRMGRIEHPHLIRLHHSNRNGVRLRDVKRWLSELRGKDMPDSFAWSYKRRYKTGYVWQDLLDDDLITPICDNEYVLKGSEISEYSLDHCSYAEKTDSMRKSEPTGEKINPSLPEIITDKSPETETEAKSTETDGTGDEPTEKSTESFSSSSTVTSPPPAADGLKKKGEKSKPGSRFGRSKTHLGGGSHVFRNLLTCGATDTNDAAVTLVNRQAGKNNGSKSDRLAETQREICKVEVLGGSDRILGGVWNQNPQQPARKSFSGGMSWKNRSEEENQKTVTAVYKPVTEPNCSQCGKTFKPEKMNTHMKSCKGLKGRVEKTSQTTRKETRAIGALFLSR